MESEVEQGTTFFPTLPREMQSSQTTAHTQARSIAEVKQALVLSQSDKDLLAPFVVQLKDLKAYETTDVEDIMAQIETEDNESAQKWKAAIEDTLYAINEEKYAELLTLIA